MTRDRIAHTRALSHPLTLRLPCFLPFPLSHFLLVAHTASHHDGRFSPARTHTLRVEHRAQRGGVKDKVFRRFRLRVVVVKRCGEVGQSKDAREEVYCELR